TVKREHVTRGKEFELGNCAQRPKSTLLLQKSVMRAMDELERLDDEFNFPDSTGAQLHVQILGGNFALDPSFKSRDFIEQLGGGASRKNEWLMVSQKFVSEFFAAAYQSRLD